MSATSGSPSPTDQSSACVTVAPGPYGYVPPYACNANWNYDPSFPAAFTFSVLFGVLMAGHIIAGLVFRKPFTWVIVMGAGWELISFVFRTLGTRDQQNLSYVEISQIFVLLAPMWINAFVYMVLARMIHFYVPSKTIFGIKAVNLSKTFVWLDVASFLIQVGGGSQITPNQEPHRLQTGIRVYQVGIGIQQVFILFFTSIAIGFHCEMSRLSAKGQAKRRWMPLLFALYAVLALITTRIVYRLDEFSTGVGEDNKLTSVETYFLVLEAVPMTLACLLLLIVHPGYSLVGPESEFPNRPAWWRRIGRKREETSASEEWKAPHRSNSTTPQSYV